MSARDRPLLGVVHLLALPGSVGHRGMRDVLQRAATDAAAYHAAGFDGLVIENFGDAPFRKGTADDPVDPAVPAALAVVGADLAERFELPIAINCLRNDGRAALGAAVVCGAQWIRVNVLSGAYATDQGIIEGEAARLLAYKQQLGKAAARIDVLADVHVKHATPLGGSDLAVAAADLAERSGAAGIVLSGDRTGQPVDVEQLDTVRDAVGAFPIWLGSGLSAANAEALWPRCDGAIVGSAVKRGGKVDNPVDPKRAAALRRACGDGND